MEKHLKDYIHLYPFCEAITDSGITGKIVRLSFDYQLCIIQFNDLGQTVSKPYADIKLLLRPLNDMTEEEATEIAIIMYGQPDSVKWRMEDKGNYFNVYRKHYSESFVIDKASGDIDRYSKESEGMELQTTLQHHFITVYMLSKGFDLFGLIDAGLAIDRTKLPDQ